MGNTSQGIKLNRLKLLTMPHPQLYTIGWLSQGQDLLVRQKCHLSYGIKHFKYAILCDVVPLEVCDVLLGQPYMWKFHVVYESRPRSVIVTLGGQLYRVPEVVLTTANSLILEKKYLKVISQMKTFVLFLVQSKGQKNITVTTTNLAQGLSTQQKQVEKVVEKYRDIFASPIGVPPHYQVKYPIDLIPGSPLRNGPI